MSKLTIVGGGFAGVWAAMSAAAERNRQQGEMINISLVSKDAFLTIRPRLYEPLSEKFRVPLSPLMKEIGVEFRTAEVASVSEEKSLLITTDRQEISYDRLVLAAGSELVVPEITGTEHCFDVDNWQGAERLDRHYADCSDNEDFIVIGASFAGIEIATELRRRFGEAASIYLIDTKINAALFMGNNPAPLIHEALELSKIKTRFGQTISAITAQGVMMESGEFITSRTVILATGMKASNLTKDVHGKRDGFGRLEVDETLKVKGSLDIYAAGDTGSAYADDEHLAYMSCQHAIQLGRFAGHNAVCDLLTKDPIPYRQKIYRTCLDLGPWGALFTVGWDPQVQSIKAEGKAIKEEIVNNLIYPPSPEEGADAIFRQISLIETVSEAAE